MFPKNTSPADNVLDKMDVFEAGPAICAYLSVLLCQDIVPELWYARDGLYVHYLLYANISITSFRKL
jgi:hypothetical protein